ncbi:hypothetical protein E1293_07890 [Actinomadura darangshiensis]|uniref:Uncharacterized protein n=1 Tax=Actinomadura darangshiensis TaxID=705336 RepID=A0A4R5BTL7_9ACTN|nr:hypothetical protein [Actinomadura darangshiensis]TDD87512.1 hypothetical protein E1293_07890 [Actinomadura darangshiensis]
MYPVSHGGAEPVLLQIGDISLTNTHVILPYGRYPLHGSTWTVQDSTQVTEGIPVVAIVLTVIFVWFCLLGLLFLLMKERKYLGFVAVSVTGPGFHHSAQFPPGPQTSAWANHAVSQARGITATAPPTI